jgi:hypothetical protein
MQAKVLTSRLLGQTAAVAALIAAAVDGQGACVP